MTTFSLEIAQYFQGTLNIIVLIMSLMFFALWQSKNARQMIDGNKSNLPAIAILATLLAIFIGLRPVDTSIFGDTVLYVRVFNLISSGYWTVDTQEKEWLFRELMRIVYDCGGTVSAFFLIVALGYVLFALWGIRRIFKNNTAGAMLFFFGAFSFFSYGTNGIRNGLASSLIILALSFALIGKHWRYIPAIAVTILAFMVHKSIIIPVVAFGVAYFIRSIKVAIIFWIISIFLYIVASAFIEQMFTGLGFDDRLSNYISSQKEYAEQGYKQGFRPDFLLYSFMPILLGWYIVEKRRITDNTYKLLLNTYIFANAVWVMLMGAAYSNRFAYLSWFMYPIVLAYPCLRMNIWGKNQGKYAGLILLAHTGFTVFMHFIYY